ncbi:MAG: putative metal-binding motif-containing protein [Myxococcota bacterium]
MTSMRLLFLFALVGFGCDVDDSDTVDEDILDEDEDGFSASVDCDDSDAKINPEATEICDNVDNNCDGDIDGGTGLTVFLDTDEDGYGDRPSPAVNCDVPFGFAAEGGDCDDNNEGVFPGADELCNSFDDDCDGATDEDAVDAAAWYEDPDGDGYGDPATEQRGCTVPPGFAYEGGDCDEDAPFINPGMPELCNDGLDDDCDPSTTENGVVTFLSYTSGQTLDLTQVFQSGTTLFPARYVNYEPGELTFCGGKWYGAIETFADLDIKGIGGSRFNELDAFERFPSLAIQSDEDDPLFVTVEGVTLRRGDAQNNGMDNYRRSGGGVFCKNVDGLVLNDVVITEARAEAGGGMYLEDCPAEIYDSEISFSNGVYGGGVNIPAGDLLMERTRLFENTGALYGGAFYANSRFGEVTVDLIDTEVSDNTATWFGSGGYFYHHWSGDDLAITCTDTDPGDAFRGGFLGNSDGYSWAAYGALYLFVIYGDTTFTSNSCDFGEEDSDFDNAPNDIYWYRRWPARTFNYGDGASFSCQGDTCG